MLYLNRLKLFVLGCAVAVTVGFVAGLPLGILGGIAGVGQLVVAHFVPDVADHIKRIQAGARCREFEPLSACGYRLKKEAEKSHSGGNSLA